MNLRDTPADTKNIGLLELVYHLRQCLDLYRLINLNADSLNTHGGSGKFWCFTQALALDGMAMAVCKMYEPEDQYERNSIPGVINSIDLSALADVQHMKIEEFVKKWAPDTSATTASQTLNMVLGRFRTEMNTPLSRLRYYRNKLGAHSDPGIKIESLPPQADFERLLEFAVSFYETVASSLIDVGPALIEAQVEGGCLRVFKKLGIENPLRNYPEDEKDEARG